jgi:hypothetical protein
MLVPIQVQAECRESGNRVISTISARKWFEDVVQRTLLAMFSGTVHRI